MCRRTVDALPDVLVVSCQAKSAHELRLWHTDEVPREDEAWLCPGLHLAVAGTELTVERYGMQLAG